MGVKTSIQLTDLPVSLSAVSLRPSIDGVMDSVYFLDDDRVMKIFETADEETVREELRLLSACAALPVTRPVGEIVIVCDKPALIYRRCGGKSLKTAKIDHIRQIGTFLREFHTLSRSVCSTNERLFEKERLADMIRQSGMSVFETLFRSIDLVLRNDGIIHGDLFLDNALFEHDTLSCVIDFTQACNGDFLFDLAVVDLAWCRDEEQTGTLLESYGAEIGIEEFRVYRNYATLYYCVNRYVNGGNYQELLEKLV